MGTFIKSLCLTLMFFAYSFVVFGGGMFLEKRALDVKHQQEEAILAREAEIKANRGAEEYHKHYEIVVSRIKTSELEGINKEALKTYIAGYDKRYKDAFSVFCAQKEAKKKEVNTAEDTENIDETANAIGEEKFKRAFDEAEISAYKSFIRFTSQNVSDNDLEEIFRD